MQSISWARLQQNPPLLLAHGQVTLAGRELSTALTELAQEAGLEKSQLHLVLAPGQYQLMLTEAPQVGDDELAAALRWKVAELLSYSVEEASLDAFALPEDAYRGRQRMAYVATCPRNAVSSLDSSFAQAQLALHSITIPEIACLRLGRLLQPAADGRALVMLSEHECQIVLIQDGHLYLSRQAPIGWSRLLQSRDFEALLLEIQRSLDYYDSQIGKGVVRQVLISPHEHAGELASYLDQNLSPEVLELDLSVWLGSSFAGVASEQALAIGAALGASA